MDNAALHLANWQTLAAAVAEQAVVDLMDAHRTVRINAVLFIHSMDFGDFLLMAGIGHTAAACRLRLTRRGILPPPEAVKRLRGATRHCRTVAPRPTDAPGDRDHAPAPPIAQASTELPAADPAPTPAPIPPQAPAPGERHQDPAEALPEVIPDPPRTMPDDCAPDNETLHGVTVIRI